MKIIYDYQIFCSQSYGGISRYFYEIASRLNAVEDNEIEIISPLFVNKFLHNDGKLKIKGLYIPRFRNSVVILRNINYYLASLLAGRADPDILHETYYSAKCSFPGSKKKVLTVYDMIHEKYSAMFSKYDKTINRKQASVSRADHVISISNNTRDDLIELYGLPEDRVTTIYLGNSLSEQHANTGARLVPEPYILYVSNRSAHKNFTSLLEAYANSKKLNDSARLVLFGGGRLTNYEHGKIAELGLAPEKILQMDGDDILLANLYKHAIAYVCPSFYEGFGIPVVEAMSMGCPVISSNRGSLAEVGGEAAQYFEPDDIEDIIHKIEQVMYSEEKRQGMIEAGYIQSARFSWQQCAEQTQKIYRMVS